MDAGAFVAIIVVGSIMFFMAVKVRGQIAHLLLGAFLFFVIASLPLLIGQDVTAEVRVPAYNVTTQAYNTTEVISFASNGTALTIKEVEHSEQIESRPETLTTYVWLGEHQVVVGWGIFSFGIFSVILWFAGLWSAYKGGNV